MPTALQIARLRRDVGADATTLSDDLATELYEEALETNDEGPIVEAHVRILYLQSLLASAARLTDYVQNQSSEKASQIFKHLVDLLEYWQGRFDDAVVGADTASSVMLGGRTKASRLRELPDNR